MVTEWFGIGQFIEELWMGGFARVMVIQVFEMRRPNPFVLVVAFILALVVFSLLIVGFLVIGLLMIMASFLHLDDF